MIDIIERARRYLVKCPASISGQGGHNAAFHAAAVLTHGFALNDPDALMLFREWNGGCVPPWSEPDLVYKLQSAASAQHSEPRGYLLGSSFAKATVDRDGNNEKNGNYVNNSTKPKPVRQVFVPKPVFCPMVLKRVAAKAKAVPDVVAFLKERSPVAVDTEDSASVLCLLYPPDSGEKILIFSNMKSQGQFLWEAANGHCVKSRHLPAGPEGVWFLPQPVDGEYKPNPRLGGKMSRRSEESVRAWRYAVLESDEAAPDDWLRCLIQMPLRIVCICESGGRSIHALVRIDAASKADWNEKIKRIKPVLVTLGADPGALSAVRLTRLPQAMRGERVQRLLYLNPSAGGQPIIGAASSKKGVA